MGRVLRTMSHSALNHYLGDELGAEWQCSFADLHLICDKNFSPD